MEITPVRFSVSLVCEELAKTLGFWMFEKFRRLARLFDNALVEKHDLIGNVSRERHLMRYDQHGSSLLGKRAHDFKHFANKFGIKR